MEINNNYPIKNSSGNNFLPLILLIIFMFVSFLFYKYKGYIGEIINEISKSTPTTTTNIIKSENNTTITSTATVTIKTENKAYNNTYNYPTQTQVKTETCYKYAISHPAFTSSKCYTIKDYNNLVDYIGDYYMAEADYKGAKNTQNFTCDGSDFFKKSCEDANKRVDNVKDKMNLLEKKIKEIITRGK